MKEIIATICVLGLFGSFFALWGIAGNDLAEATKAEVVQVLGFKITLYRVSKKDKIKHLL